MRVTAAATIALRATLHFLQEVLALHIVEFLRVDRLRDIYNHCYNFAAFGPLFYDIILD